MCVLEEKGMWQCGISYSIHFQTAAAIWSDYVYIDHCKLASGVYQECHVGNHQYTCSSQIA